MDDAARRIREMDQTFIHHVRTGNLDRLVNDFYADDAKVLPPNQPIVIGKAAILDLWRGVLNSGVSDLSLETTHVEQSGDLAYGTGTYTMTIRAAAGEKRDSGKYVIVYRRSNDGWKAIVDMFSSNEPAG
jgi:ketosteroid isomerase-like protein